MSQAQDFPLPPSLPPINDGTADHLRGMSMPGLRLPSTQGRIVDLSDSHAPTTVSYRYPMTGVPGKPLPEGWDMIPGARACTPQTCGCGIIIGSSSNWRRRVFGLSAQTTAYQWEMATRLQLPFEILSDAQFTLCDAWRLPTFEVDEMRLLRRLTLIVSQGQIVRVVYPVSHPTKMPMRCCAGSRSTQARTDRLGGTNHLLRFDAITLVICRNSSAAHVANSPM
jgi:peroxiredoxin